jgi:hypothetical protein
MHPRHEIAPRNFGGICTAPHDRADNYGLSGTGGCAGARRNRDSIAYLEVCLGGKRFIDCDCARWCLGRRGRLQKQREGKKS